MGQWEGRPYALPQIIAEIAENKKEHKMLVTTGGGTRSRHIYVIGLELGMPTGILAKFGNSISEQNALLVHHAPCPSRRHKDRTR